jgi:WD40 repeat protein
MQIKVDRTVFYIAIIMVLIIPVSIVVMNMSGCGVRQADFESPIPSVDSISTVLPTRSLVTATGTKEILPTPSNTVTIPAGAREVETLSTAPPWLYYPDISIGAFRVINSSGTEFMVLAKLPPPYSKLHASSNGIHMAYVTCNTCTPVLSEDDPDVPLNDESLIIVNVPEGKVEKEIALTSSISTYSATEHEVWMDISATVGSFAWSPNGQTLAFTASIDGDSSDLYVYDVNNQAITRLTWGSGQAYSPTWSPDGKWIVHQEVRQMMHTLGYRVDAVWASSPSGSNNIMLYDANGEYQSIREWISSSEFVVVHKNEDPGSNRLYKASLRGNDLTTLYEGPIATFVIESNGDSAILWLMNDETIFLKYPYADTGTSLDLSDVNHLYYFEELESFVIGSDSAISIVSTEGVITQTIDDSGYVAVAPGGEWFAVYPETYSEFDTGSGLRLYTKGGDLMKEISSGDIDQAFWSPDGLYLYWVEDMILLNYGVEDGNIKIVIDQLPELWSFRFSWIPE